MSQYDSASRCTCLLSCTVRARKSRRLRERIESALALHLYAQPGMVGAFQEEGVHYRPRWPSEEPVQVRFRCGAMLLGVPEWLWV
jgi:hypothetical protein